MDQVIKEINTELFAAKMFYEMKNPDAYKISMIRVAAMLRVLNMMSGKNYGVVGDVVQEVEE